MNVLTKLEIDVMQINELQEAVDLSVKYTIPAIVVHQSLINYAVIERLKKQGQFKIITPVDWPKGDTYGMNKLRGLTKEALSTDGFEIMLTDNKSSAETTEEARILCDFIKDHLDPSCEVRYVLGMHNRKPENIKSMCEGLLDVRMPQYIRTDNQLKLQANKANSDIHNAHISTICEIMRVPLKISGNIGTVRSITSCKDAKRFAVNVQQAKSIIREINQQPDALKNLLV